MKLLHFIIASFYSLLLVAVISLSLGWGLVPILNGSASFSPSDVVKLVCLILLMCVLILSIFFHAKLFNRQQSVTHKVNIFVVILNIILVIASIIVVLVQRDFDIGAGMFLIAFPILLLADLITGIIAIRRTSLVTTVI